eukprot:scaffold459_cov249-Pinguiococcus_pyrenoidosus.AAC.7
MHLLARQALHQAAQGRRGVAREGAVEGLVLRVQRGEGFVVVQEHFEDLLRGVAASEGRQKRNQDPKEARGHSLPPPQTWHFAGPSPDRLWSRWRWARHQSRRT